MFEEIMALLVSLIGVGFLLGFILALIGYGIRAVFHIMNKI